MAKKNKNPSCDVSTTDGEDDRSNMDQMESSLAVSFQDARLFQNPEKKQAQQEQEQEHVVRMRKNAG
jgi:hypothetical protein